MLLAGLGRNFFFVKQCLYSAKLTWTGWNDLSWTGGNVGSRGKGLGTCCVPGPLPRWQLTLKQIRPGFAIDLIKSPMLFFAGTRNRTQREMLQKQRTKEPEWIKWDLCCVWTLYIFLRGNWGLLTQEVPYVSYCNSLWVNNPPYCFSAESTQTQAFYILVDLPAGDVSKFVQPLHPDLPGLQVNLSCLNI